MAVLLGCIADDFTGGTDLAGMLVKSGMKTIQLIGVPTEPAPDDVDAVVIALKSRTNPAPEAIEESLRALEWLKSQGCQQFFFKYCSTFDSTPKGNIGPVAEALMKALDTKFTIACPAFPANKRSIYKGHLFVGDDLLSESGMRNHPLTPMTDSNLVRVLQQQVQSKVGLTDYSVVKGGAGVIQKRFADLRKDGNQFSIVDALSDIDLYSIGAACADLPLVTGGSGIALGLPENFRKKGLLKIIGDASKLGTVRGLKAVIAGSCSVATQEQVRVMKEKSPAYFVDPLALVDGRDVVTEALEWVAQKIVKGPVLIYATSSPETVKSIQDKVGIEKAGEMVEHALAQITKGLIKLGVGQLIVAGGETSGAVVKALGISGLRIGPEIAPGVPWTKAIFTEVNHDPLVLALKSGNFGSPQFFNEAWDYIQ
ncbi:3-oxo-tetronate kinase [Polynucleobacter asymbioticus]|jgi:uncharacterized protein YgbK (DUF1537 family)|uniref:3-oxo-tetronate kinase n=1 Tax=Polynucleobacter asymbioticus TaxID=576611 RepID=A0AAC9IY27_9BURK|nr:3-oxo-tetronate kinase [Polynucleobacter asymbioticus]APB99501.1 hypothetical protein A4F89_09225 [Polynucleobacter asymbioticus]APC01808.1 hypothetical protein AOC25_09360 [Polynucleobacter asymbioticus]